MRIATAIIPARGGSEGIKRKNLQKIAGKSLIERSVAVCLKAQRISRVVVSTDDEEIGAAAVQAGALVIWRPSELADSFATSESALEHAIRELTFIGDASEHAILLVQCTSPFTRSETLDNLIQKLDEYESVFTGVPTHTFLWRSNASGVMESVNHSHTKRLRRQDLQPDFIESGNAYGMQLEGFQLTRNRFFGRIGVQQIDSTEWHEIDSEWDLELARYRADLDSRFHLSARNDLSNIKAIVFGINDCVTDNHAIPGETEFECVALDIRTSDGIRRILDNGFQVLILTKDPKLLSLQKACDLEPNVFWVSEAKADTLAKWVKKRNLDFKNVAYFGYQIADVAPMKRCGFTSCPRNAHQSVREIADYVIGEDGVYGAIEKFCELFLGKEGIGALK